MANPNSSKRQPLVRIDAADKIILEELAAKTGDSLPKLLHQAIGLLETRLFFDRMNEAYKELREDPVAWAAELEERALFSNADSDGLENEPPYEK